jgi:homospermidine synthase
VDSDGKRTSMRSACHYAYEAVDDTALTLADPLSAYATLPFKMTLNGRELSKVELRDLVNAEQRRLGKKAVDTVKQGARDAVDKVKSAVGGN